MALPEQQQNTESKSPVQRDASTAAFEFVRELSAELSQSTIELPSFPEVAVRVQKALSEENCSSERVVRVIGAEPMLATRVLQMANSAALNPGGKPVAELRTAVTRLGFDALRAATVSFAMAQLRSAAADKGVQRCALAAERAGRLNVLGGGASRRQGQCRYRHAYRPGARGR
jgi:HD-like signal output (HDOD) protein